MQTNLYADQTFEKASELLRLSISLMSQRRIPPSPFNYRLAYDCASGQNEDLNTAFEQLPDSVGADDLFQLYLRFFVQDDEALMRIRDEFKRLVVSIQGEFAQSGGQLEDYVETLDAFAKLLDVSTPAEKMTEQVARIRDATRSVGLSQRSLESHAAGVVEEIEVLRSELEQVRRESMTDALTKIANRKAFDSELEEQIAFAKESGEPLSLLLLDIDHFKLFNDTHGHLVGDKVIRFVGATLRKTIKGTDFAARYGGEEFAVILPHTARDGAAVVADQIRRAIGAKNLVDEHTKKNFGVVTISVGVAQYARGDGANELIRQADEALYSAKENGRNRVEQAA